MLYLTSLLNKEEFTKPNGDTVLNLIYRAVSYLNIQINSGKAYVVTEDTCMRPDLISTFFYQRADFADLILKYNGYSNPFSLNVGDLIRIPDGETIQAFGKKPKPAQYPARKKAANVNFNKASKKDKRRAEYLLKKAGAVPAVAPNIALDASVKIANGKIVFGADVTSVKKEDCPIPISRAKLIETLIKNKNAK
jgi:hypothetical protein